MATYIQWLRTNGLQSSRPPKPTGMPREIILGSTHQKGGGKGRKKICQFTRPWHGRNKEDANCPHGHPSEMHTANLDSRDTYRIMVSRVYVNSDAPIFRRLAWQNYIHRRKFVAHGFQTNLNGQFWREKPSHFMKVWRFFLPPSWEHTLRNSGSSIANGWPRRVHMHDLDYMRSMPTCGRSDGKNLHTLWKCEGFSCHRLGSTRSETAAVQSPMDGLGACTCTTWITCGQCQHVEDAHASIWHLGHTLFRKRSHQNLLASSHVHTHKSWHVMTSKGLLIRSNHLPNRRDTAGPDVAPTTQNGMHKNGKHRWNAMRKLYKENPDRWTWQETCESACTWPVTWCPNIRTVNLAPDWPQWPNVTSTERAHIGLRLLRHSMHIAWLDIESATQQSQGTPDIDHTLWFHRTCLVNKKQNTSSQDTYIKHL